MSKVDEGRRAKEEVVITYPMIIPRVSKDNFQLTAFLILEHRSIEIGIGTTEDDAWIDAAKRLKEGR